MLHIDLPTRADILKLAHTRGSPCVTIYVATTPLTEAAQAGRTALKNLAREAIGQLEAVGSAKRSLGAIEDAVSEIEADDAFWAHQANSLAIFLTDHDVTTYRLPSKLENQVHVSDRFHIKPILRAVTFPHNAYVLAISKGHVRLIEVSADLPAHEVKVPRLPHDMADALGRSGHKTSSDDMRNAGTGSESALLTRYARAVDAALRPVLSGHERPLIVAASEPLSSLFRKISSYPHTAAQSIAGSADHTPDHELAAAARGVLDGIYAGQIAEFAALFAERANQGRAVTDVAQAARAATFGAIDTLIVDIDDVLPGTVADDDGRVSFAAAPGADSYGVIDEIVSRALKSGARVISARKGDVPGNGPLAATLRYPM
jgi:Bacterial archaeo-eukaryotic release factor family 11